MDVGNSQLNLVLRLHCRSDLRSQAGGGIVGDYGQQEVDNQWNVGASLSF